MYKKSDLSQTEDTSTDSCGKFDVTHIEEDKEFKSAKLLRLKYNPLSDALYITDRKTKQVLNKMRTSTFRRGSMLSKFSSLNLYEKEIIVWLKLNHVYYIDTTDLISELMLRFNISETKSSYLIDHSGI